MAHHSSVILVPFKNPTHAKQRLASRLTPAQRRTLALTLLDHTLAVLAQVRDADTVVVTTTEEIAERVRACGAMAIIEQESRGKKGGNGETAAVEFGTRWSMAEGYTRQIVVPGDMAALEAADVEAILRAPLPGAGVVLAPAVGDDGTNAIMTSPPNCLPFRFGKASFPEYLERAAALRLSVRVMRLPSFVLDIDSPEDLDSFLAAAPNVPAISLLKSWGIH